MESTVVLRWEAVEAAEAHLFRRALAKADGAVGRVLPRACDLDLVAYLDVEHRILQVVVLLLEIVRTVMEHGRFRAAGNGHLLVGAELMLVRPHREDRVRLIRRASTGEGKRRGMRRVGRLRNVKAKPPSKHELRKHRRWRWLRLDEDRGLSREITIGGIEQVKIQMQLLTRTELESDIGRELEQAFVGARGIDHVHADLGEVAAVVVAVGAARSVAPREREHRVVRSRRRLRLDRGDVDVFRRREADALVDIRCPRRRRCQLPRATDQTREALGDDRGIGARVRRVGVRHVVIVAAAPTTCHEQSTAEDALHRRGL